MKVRTIWDSRDSLTKVLGCPNLDHNVAWRLKGLTGEYYQLEESLMKFFQSYPTEERDGVISVVPDDRAEYLEKTNAFLDEEFTGAIPKIQLSEVKDANLTPRDLYLLDWLIVNESMEGSENGKANGNI